MKLASLVMVLVSLSLIGGFAVAGWIGLAVAILFFVTILADAAIRMRSPRSRALRAIARSLPTDIDAVEFHIHEVRQQPTANPHNQAHPASDDEG